MYSTNWPVKLNGKIIETGKPIEPGEAADDLLAAGAIHQAEGAPADTGNKSKKTPAKAPKVPAPPPGKTE